MRLFYDAQKERLSSKVLSQHFLHHYNKFSITTTNYATSQHVMQHNIFCYTTTFSAIPQHFLQHHKNLCNTFSAIPQKIMQHHVFAASYQPDGNTEIQYALVRRNIVGAFVESVATFYLNLLEAEPDEVSA